MVYINLLNQFRHWSNLFQVILAPGFSWIFLVIYLLFVMQPIMSSTPNSTLPKDINYVSFNDIQQTYFSKKSFKGFIGNDDQLRNWPVFSIPNSDSLPDIPLSFSNQNKNITWIFANNSYRFLYWFNEISDPLVVGGFGNIIKRTEETIFIRTSLYVNTTFTHSPGILLNCLSNILLETLYPEETILITAGYHPFLIKSIPVHKDNGSTWFWKLVLCVLAAYEIPTMLCQINIFFAAGEQISERNLGMELQLILNGVSPGVFWFSSYISKVLLVSVGGIVTLTAMYLAPLAAGIHLEAFEKEVIIIMIISFLLYGMSNVGFGLFISRFFKTPDGMWVLSTFIYLLAFAPFVFMLTSSSIESVIHIHNLSALLNPIYPLVGVFAATFYVYLVGPPKLQDHVRIDKLSSTFSTGWIPGFKYLSEFPTHSTGNNWVDPKFGVSVPIMAMILHCIIFFLIIVFWPNPASKFGHWLAHLKEPKITKHENGSVSERERLLSSEIDDDVKEEENRLQLNDDNLRVQNLMKIFPLNRRRNENDRSDEENRNQGGCGPFCQRRPKFQKKFKNAVDEISFGTGNGSVFALLGPNGAGKSTCISLIVGEQSPTSGSVLFEGKYQPTDKEIREYIGYCSQNNVLWPRITPAEHLWFLQNIKSDSKFSTISGDLLLARLGINHQKDIWTEKMSGGNRRKIVYALSTAGNPKFAILDEPSTGLDPNARHLLWDNIRLNQVNQTTLLTSHSLEEIDVLSTRITIMINGRLRCIGTSQHLKSKFGRSYILEIVASKISHDNFLSENSSIREFVIKNFPDAIERDSFDTIQRWEIPVKNIKSRRTSSQVGALSLADAFRIIENERKNGDLGIEAFSLAQPTLEQVFLLLAKNQEIDED
ncbi:ATP-binding cassette sub- A member 5 [Nowakowskiella sp. JEL0078]|nr:ATP-binding cassette sub- A member 5 [Nowakowskiella sp. JEL0078]